MTTQPVARRILGIATGLACLLSSLPAFAAPPERPRLVLTQSIPLPKVKGGFDYMAVDLRRRRLFANAEDNNTTEVVDLSGQGSLLKSLSGMHTPKWPAYRADLNRLYIANGDGELKVLDGASFRPLGAVALPPPANNLRFDAATGALLVGVGDVEGGLAVVDPRTNSLLRTVKLAAFPKQFELEGDKAYVNEPAKRLVQVVNWKTGWVLQSWSLGDCENVPMALDRRGRRLFVGCRGGALLVLSARDGQVLSTTTIPRDVDGVHYDDTSGRLYVTTGEGFIDVLASAKGGGFQRIERVATRSGAGTSIFSASLKSLFVAIPQVGDQAAEIRTYRLTGP